MAGKSFEELGKIRLPIPPAGPTTRGYPVDRSKHAINTQCTTGFPTVTSESGIKYRVLIEFHGRNGSVFHLKHLKIKTRIYPRSNWKIFSSENSNKQKSRPVSCRLTRGLGRVAQYRVTFARVACLFVCRAFVTGSVQFKDHDIPAEPTNRQNNKMVVLQCQALVTVPSPLPLSLSLCFVF